MPRKKIDKECEKCTTCKGTGRIFLKAGSVMFPISEPCPNCTRDD